mgnify:CR=1 FL=1
MAKLTPREGENLISQAEHAKRCGVSRVAVTKWKAAGRLVFVGDLVDHEASYKGESWHAGVKKSRQEPAAAAPAQKPAKTRKAAAEPPKTVLPPAPPADAPQVGPAGSTALKEAVTRKEEFAGRLRELEFLKQSGQLVDRDAAARVQFDQGRLVRDKLLNFAPAECNFMAAELGIEADKLAQVLTKYVHKLISSLAEPPAKLG